MTETENLSQDEIISALNSTENGKAVGTDNILPEFIKKLGPLVASG